MTGTPFKKVFLQTIISALLSFATFAFGFVRVYYFSKHLAMEEFGVLSLLLTISAFLLYAFTLGSFQFLFKRVNEGLAERRSAFWACTILTIVISLFGLLFTYVFLEEISGYLELQHYKQELLLMVLASVTTALMTIFLYYHYGLGRNNFQNFLQFLRGSLWVIVSIVVALFFDLQLMHILWIINLSMIGILLFSAPWKEASELLRGGIKNLEYKKLFKYCLPLMPYFAGVWGIPMIVRTQLNIHDGSKNVAIFSIAYALMEIVFMFISTITATLSPYFFAESGNNQKSGLFYNIMLKYSILSIVIIVPFIFMLRNDLILLVASEKYLVATEYIPLLILFPLLRVLIIVFEQFYLKGSQTVYLGVIYIISMAASFLLAIILIPRYSIYGAIVASLVSYFIIFICLFVKQRDLVDYIYLKIPAIFLLLIILCSGVLGLGYLQFSNWIKALPLALTAVAGVYYLPILNNEEKNKLAVLLKLKK